MPSSRAQEESVSHGPKGTGRPVRRFQAGGSSAWRNVQWKEWRLRQPQVGKMGQEGDEDSHVRETRRLKRVVIETKSGEVSSAARRHLMT